MVSLKDIATQCGVSVATVSKALNDQPDISEATRDRIRQVADEMGYMSNAAARALKTNRSYNIGILFVDPQNGGLAHEFFSSMLDSIRVEAELHDYDITFIRNSTGNSFSYLQHCLYRGLDGVLIASVDYSEPMVIELIESDLPVVTVDQVFNNHIAILSDNIQGMETLTRYVIRKGHRKLAFLHGEMTSVTKNRLTGFHRACRDAGITLPEGWIRNTPFHDPESCYQATTELLTQPDRPSCIFFPDDFSFIGGMNAIHDLGLRIPEDVSAVGYDGIPLSQMLSPRLTTWKQDTKELGKRAVSSLIELIESPQTAILDRYIVSGSLLEGESVLQL